MTTLRWGAATDVGLVRRINEDQLLTVDGLYAVADGMGGHAAGDVASGVAVAALRDAYAGRPRTAEELVGAMHRANTAVYEKSIGDKALRGMGTTLTAAALIDADGEERIAIANVGDSRTYVFAHNELTQLTEDHSIPEELVRQGQLDPSEVDTHPQRHILTRALGIQPEIEVDVWEVLPVAGDRIVLCSDGLVREVTDDQIAGILRRRADPNEAARELVARARAEGGSDNITVVIVDVVDDGGLVEKAAAAVDTSAAANPPATAREDAGEAAQERVGEGAGETAGEPTGEGGREGSAPVAATSDAPKRRRVTLRVVAFVILLLAVFGGAAAAVVYFARGTYFVTYGPAGSAAASPFTDPTSRPILVYQGRPGGLLWFQPTLAERTRFVSNEVCPARAADLQKGHPTGSRAEADRFINNLITEAQQTCGAP